MDFESDVLSEISQTEKSKINGIDCIWNLKKKKKGKKLIKADNRLVIAEAGDWGERNVCRLSQGTNFQS